MRDHWELQYYVKEEILEWLTTDSSKLIDGLSVVPAAPAGGISYLCFWPIGTAEQKLYWLLTKYTIYQSESVEKQLQQTHLFLVLFVWNTPENICWKQHTEERKPLLQSLYYYRQHKSMLFPSGVFRAMKAMNERSLVLSCNLGELLMHQSMKSL